MTTQTMQAADRVGFGRPPRPRRLAVAVALLALGLAPGEFGALTRGLMVDAYVQVSAFVAATLLLFYGAERVFRFDIGQVLNNARTAQVPMAALLGATPGCGGAVVVVAAYGSGHVSFGAVVATLTATMGDAAFLLIATRPEAAAVVLPLSFGVGILSGWIIDGLKMAPALAQSGHGGGIAPRIGPQRKRDFAFLAVALPGLVLGITQLTGADIGAVFGPGTILAIGLAGTAIGVAIWATSPVHAMTNPADGPVTRMAEETSFISVWVIGAYLAYDYAAAYAGLDIEAMFAAVAPLLPLIAIAVGFVPGCGPQVLVTTLYINGLVPFSALVGNAISNDGDALFPAIALNPRAAVLATVYSAVPALIVAYGFYFWAPGFMN
ncbi:Putative, 10TM heavy-metal exporter [Lutimaribacter pacificus]|uniref:Putative, 10TM heavy-metal exporter n=1 Tax=Lutimaribacter pacificus TaxID=391948 RepID=A0A1H0C5X6_9RHOB|nr:putative manganese transporter [Lutimaribacter pacificus]SDN53261.1 Putative, 10TM heavy-metal exporter [Lutimaribacter pacificus]SHJ48370.1 Putative, 10TM heavy-metal exporter [Lutimaribacter pacificus]